MNKPQVKDGQLFVVPYHNRYVLGVVVLVPKKVTVNGEVKTELVNEYRPVKIVPRHRSKYNPHIGLRQQSRRDMRPACSVGAAT